MSQRDELASLVYAHGLSGTPNSVADAILAAGFSRPQVVETVEELDALPVFSVVRDAKEYVHERWDDAKCEDWAQIGCDSRMSSSVALPATVLYMHEEAK